MDIVTASLYLTLLISALVAMLVLASLLVAPAQRASALTDGGAPDAGVPGASVVPVAIPVEVRGAPRAPSSSASFIWGGCWGFLASALIATGFLFGAVAGAARAEGVDREAKELSVAPIGAAAATQYPADRPEWIKNPPKVEGQTHIVVSSGPWNRRHDCEHALNEELKREVDAYINDHLENPRAATLIGYDLATIQQELVSHEPGHVYGGALVSPTVGEMHEEVRLLAIDEQDQRHIEDRWRRVVATSRLASTGLIAAGVLGFLMVAYGFMKADTATRGFYTGRLQLLSLAIVAAMIAGGLFIARAIPWM